MSMDLRMHENEDEDEDEESLLNDFGMGKMKSSVYHIG